MATAMSADEAEDGGDEGERAGDVRGEALLHRPYTQRDDAARGDAGKQPPPRAPARSVTHPAPWR